MSRKDWILVVGTKNKVEMLEGGMLDGVDEASESRKREKRERDIGGVRGEGCSLPLGFYDYFTTRSRSKLSP